jgi:hypothetical protein
MDKIGVMSSLLARSREDYGQYYDVHFMDIYKMFVEMADRVSQRRGIANSFYVSVNAALIALVSFLVERAEENYAILVLLGILICICLVWASNINAYKRLNSAKFDVICEMEKMLPVRAYGAEWDILTNKKHKTLCFNETFVPYCCIFLYALYFIYSLI